MKIIKLLMLCLAGVLWIWDASAQPANASLNILTGSSGQVALGGTVDIQVTVGNTGPNSILGFKVRVQISVPTAIASILPNAQQTGLPAGWTITTNASGAITICNGTDVIPAGIQRQIFIKIQGIAIGGPSTINGQLLFSNGTSCAIPGSLNGDNTADNNSTSSIQVIAAPNCTLTSVSASAGTIACNGGTTTLTATATTGGAVTLEYNLNGGTFQSSNVFTVGAGTYTVTAREVSTPACSATAPAVSVTEPTAVATPLINTITQPTCITATGSVELSGLPPGNWTINPGNITGNTAATTINGLAPGTYNFTVTNAAGCTSTATGNVVVNTQPLTPAAPVRGSIMQPTCALSTGSVVLSGLPPGNWLINPGAISGNTTTITINNLNPGTYNFTVTNEATCTSSPSADVIINSVPGAPPAPTVNIVQPTCTVATGTITITSTTTGILFSLDGGAYASYPAGGYVVPAGPHTLTEQNASGCISAVTNITMNAQPLTPEPPAVSVIQPTCTTATGTISITSSITGLTFSLDGGAYADYPAGGYLVATGSHTLTAQNASGCISAVTNITVDLQSVPPTAVVSAGVIGCNGGTTTLTVTSTGGSGPLEYSFDGGVTFQPANTFTVSAGTYTITVRDTNLCTGTATITINQPPAITASVSAGAIACNGGTTTLIITATGGVSPLQYSLNGGAFQSANNFIVGAGTFTFTVRDANQCTATTTTTITQAANLIASASAKRITQCGGTTMVIVTATGGTTPYTSGVDTFTRGPGTWSFPITDSGGCTDTTEITIDAPGCMDLQVFPNPAKNSITINHTTAETGAVMQVFAINGARVIYQLVLQNAFQTTVNVSKLTAGSYVIVYWSGSEKKKTQFIKVSSD